MKKFPTIIVLLGISIALLTQLNAYAQIPQSGLIAYYPFNNSANNVVTGNFN